MSSVPVYAFPASLSIVCSPIGLQNIPLQKRGIISCPTAYATVKCLRDEGVEAGDVGAHQIETASPEVGRAQIKSKARSQCGGVGLAGGGQQVIIAGGKGFGVALVARIQAQTKEQPKHIREVIK